MDFILFDEAQNDEALAYNEFTDYKVIPRRIDQLDHPLFGDYAAPTRIVTGLYGTYWADKLGGHERLTADPEALFVPSEV